MIGTPSGKYALAVDLGGTKIAAALATPEGEIVAREQRPTPAREGPQAVVAGMVGALAQVMKRSGVVVGQVMGIGIGAAGACDPQAGLVISSPNLPGWHRVPLKTMVERELGLATFLENDANLGALGEHRFGAGKGIANLIYVTIGTGIGGGLILGGRLYTGACGSAGEVGHMTIDVNGPRCNCGNVGCWEVLASGTALAREAVARIQGGVSTSILELAGGDLGRVSAEVVERAARQGDGLAQELVLQAGRYLGVGLVNLVNIFNPELILIGGGMSKMSDLLFPTALGLMRERAFEVASSCVRIEPAGLGGDSGLLGAVALVLDKAGH